MSRKLAIFAVLGAVFQLAASCAATAETIKVASTTSTEASGLFDHLLPKFTRATGINVRVIAVGTGQAIRLARRGDADVLLVHHRPSEEAFVRDGFGLKRHNLMYNDFILVGPSNDPAGITDAKDAAGAMAMIRDAKAIFVSRGDDSGTHKRELSLWRVAGIAKAQRGDWYREIGAGMGRTLNTAAAMPAYTLVDRGTWLSFGNKRGLKLLLEADPRLRNPYGVIVVNPRKHPHVKVKAAQRFVDWLTSPVGQKAIGSFRVNGAILFHPSAAASRPSQDGKK